MEKIVLDGNVFVKASSAADALGYTRDYIGQLCRAGTVEAHLVGRSWYVNQEQLRLHKIEKKRLSRTKAREQVRKSIEEAKQASQGHSGKHTDTGGSKSYEGRITYEPDEKELIPEVKKLSVDTAEKNPKKGISKKEKRALKKKKEKEPDYIVENEGEKVVLSGEIAVTDASEESKLLDEDATIFHTKIVEGRPGGRKKESGRFNKESKDISVSETAGTGEENVTLRKEHTIGGQTSFEKKLTKRAIQHEKKVKRGAPTPSGKKPSKEAATTENVSKQALWPAYAFLLVVMFASVGAVLIETKWTATQNSSQQGEIGQVSAAYRIDLEDIQQYLNRK